MEISKMAILFVEGVNDSCKVSVTLDRNNQIVYLLDGNCSVYGRLPLKKGMAANAVLFGKSVRQYHFNFSVIPSLIFNQISDADTHGGCLQRCIELCAQLDSYVINRPEQILKTTRDSVARLLQGIPGVTIPRTLRIKPRSPDDVFASAATENLGFPFIIRMVGTHGGQSVSLLNSREDYPSLHVYPFDGRDYYLIEYLDLKDSDGLFHKQRLAMIDGEPILRHTLYDQNWKVSAASRSFMSGRGETWDEYHARAHTFENEIIPRAKPAIKEITKRLGLEYYGIDCNIGPDGQMTIFEANASMNILFNELKPMNNLLKEIERRIVAMLVRYSGENII